MRLLPMASIRGTAASPTPLECAGALLDGLPQTIWFIRRQMRGHRGGSLTVPQFRALVLLSRYPAASLSDVADHLGSTLPSVSRMVAGLVARGFIIRQGTDGDRRRVSLACSRRGQAVLARAQGVTQTRLANELTRLSDAERTMVMEGARLLQRTFRHVDGPADLIRTNSESTAPRRKMGKRRVPAAQLKKRGNTR